MNEDVYLDKSGLNIIGSWKTARRIGLKPEILEWLTSRFGPMSRVDEDGIRFWAWSPKHDSRNNPTGARIWIKDPDQRILFKLTWGGVL